MARPRLPIDEKQVENLAAIDCSFEEMATILECSVSILHKRFSTVIERGRARGRSSLKRKQFEAAMVGDKTMLVWLGKVRLGQKETQVLQMQELPAIVIR